MLPNYSPKQKSNSKSKSSRSFKKAGRVNFYKSVDSSKASQKNSKSFIEKLTSKISLDSTNKNRKIQQTSKSSKKTAIRSNNNSSTTKHSGRVVRSQSNFPLRNILLTVGAITMIAIIYFGFNDIKRIYHSYNTFEIKNSLNDSSTRFLFDKDESIEKNIVIITDKAENSSITDVKNIYLVIRNNETNGMQIIKIPDWIYIQSTIDTSVDQQSIKNLHYIGNSRYENPVGYIIHEISNTFAISFDNYILLEPGAQDYYEDITSSYRIHNYPEDLESDDFKRFYNLIQSYSYVNWFERLAKLDKLSGQIDSNLSLWEVDRLFTSLHSNLSSNELYLLDMDLDGAYEDIVLSNGKKVRSVSTAYLDSYIRANKSVFQTRELLREQAKIELLNGGEISGAATRYSRRIRNTGMFVTRVDNSPESFERTTIYISNPEKFTVTVNILKSLIPIDIEVKEGRPEFLTTGDVVLVLGKDLKDEYSLDSQ